MRTTGTTAGTKNSGILNFLSKSEIQQRDMDDFVKKTNMEHQDKLNRHLYLNEVYEAPSQSGMLNFLSHSHLSKTNNQAYRGAKADLENGLNMDKVLNCAYSSNEGKKNIMHKTMNFPKNYTISRNQESIGRLNMMRGSDASIYGKYVDTLDS